MLFPKVRDNTGQEVAAVRGVLASLMGMFGNGVTHMGVATDHVIESFRNDLWPGYKTGEGVEPDLLAQFPLLEEALSALGIVVWRMVEFEADDALAAAANAAANDPRVERVIICTPDKDLAQCVRGTRVVQLDRRKNITRDEVRCSREIRSGAGFYTGLSCPRGRLGRRLSRYCPAGARNRLPLCSRDSIISNPFLQIGESGASALPAPRHCRVRSSPIVIRLCSFGFWRRCARTFRCLIPSTSWNGKGPTADFAPLAARLDSSVAKEKSREPKS